MYSLSKKEGRQIGDYINKFWPHHIPWNLKNLKAIDTEKHGRLLISDDIIIIESNQKLVVPHLTQDAVLNYFPFVIVDMGAVAFICNGANVMRPGITSFDKFEQSELVVIKDVVHEKKIAVGISRFDNEKMKTFDKGPVITNLHYVGDIFWNLKKELRR